MVWRGAWLGLLLIACDAAHGPQHDADFATAHALVAVDPAATIAPLPRSVQLDARKVALGERLFRDARMSGDGRVTCADCHALERGGANAEARSSLPNRRPVPVNVPTIFNVAFDFRYGWDGRFEDLEGILDFAIKSPAAMAGSWEHAASAISGVAEYTQAFAGVYREGVAPNTLRDAIASYCRSLITPDARFDRYLRGELSLSPAELRGYELFREYGCTSCHQGRNVGGNMFQRFGAMQARYADSDATAGPNLGRFNTTKRERDRYVFRVPSLRNVAKTAPYFHDASAPTLEAAVTVMARHQLARELDASEVDAIAAFLRTLTGEYRGRAL